MNKKELEKISSTYSKLGVLLQQLINNRTK